MINVRGQELPFSDNKGKQEWYASEPQVLLPITVLDHIDRLNESGVTGKEDVFWTTLIPAAEELEIETVFDVGGGQGRLAAFWAQLGYTVTSSELIAERTRLLRESLDSHGFQSVKTITQDIEEANEIGIYDLIFMSDIVEHLINWEETIQKVAQSCRYCYMLIPGDDSWNWSPDHLHRFDLEKITKLMNMFDDVEFLLRVRYDDENYWYSLLMKGFI